MRADEQQDNLTRVQTGVNFSLPLTASFDIVVIPCLDDPIPLQDA